jgi:hypothetical protein
VKNWSIDWFLKIIVWNKSTWHSYSPMIFRYFLIQIGSWILSWNMWNKICNSNFYSYHSQLNLEAITTIGKAFRDFVQYIWKLCGILNNDIYFLKLVLKSGGLFQLISVSIGMNGKMPTCCIHDTSIWKGFLHFLLLTL